MTTSLSRSRQAGFSLIEIMVAVVIGMVGVIIMTQVLMQSDSARRNTTSGDDAQINASIALSGIERDIRMSGYGLNSLNLLGCSWTFTPSSESSALTSALSIGPVVINPATSLVPAGDANTDTLLVMYGTSNSPAEGDALIAASASTTFKMTTAPSFATNDRTIALPLPRTASCSVRTDRVTNVPGDGTISVANGLSGIKAGDVLYNLGAKPIVRAYAVRNGNLTVCDYTVYNCSKTSYTSTLNSDVWVPVGNNVVSLRAQYGQDKTAGTMAGVVTDFDRTTPSSSAFPACAWTRLLTVRLAVVARGGQYDKDVVTGAVPTWSGSGSIAFNLGSGSDWQHYRYKTVETAVPLRNMLWQGNQPSYQGGESGC
ncbi:PilW family protein [Comamonas sp. JUb58]|uniref:PilW family protein n=1 Tax=Comamonas sp. JUb58 TaxID=2485114 RepID=UPI00105E092B|nr:PilW family protein [Comamonas sp. JUb58]TDS83240.1 type IV pilus assembly protein PilW [Comamonas sp. JUb58]